MDALAEPAYVAGAPAAGADCSMPSGHSSCWTSTIQTIDPSGLRQYIVLQDMNSAARITVISGL